MCFLEGLGEGWSVHKQDPWFFPGQLCVATGRASGLHLGSLAEGQLLVLLHSGRVEKESESSLVFPSE